MLDQLSRAKYLPTLKWKQGELKALKSFRGDRREVIPLFDIPPAGSFDHELGRVPEPLEYLKQFGPRLQDAWGQRIAFIDAAQIDNDRHREGLPHHPLTELINRAHRSNAVALPVTGLGRSAGYQAAVRAFLDGHPGSPICIRLSAGNYLFDLAGMLQELKLLMFELAVKPHECFLLVDFGPFDPHDPDQLVTLLAPFLDSLPNLHNWAQVGLSMTGFPQAPKLKAGEIGRFQRSEWEVYKRLIAAPLLRRPIFGDYALEHPALGPTGRISPVAQARYSTEDELIIFKGATTRQNGYKVIFPVLDALLADAAYAGPGYSFGDAYFHKLATERRSPGNAPKWRWAATDHHLTQALACLRVALGMPAFRAEDIPQPQPQQLELL